MTVHTGYLSHVITHDNNNKEIIMSPVTGGTQGQGMGSEHLMELWVSLFIAEELDELTFKGPFQLKQFCDSMIQTMQEHSIRSNRIFCL